MYYKLLRRMIDSGIEGMREEWALEKWRNSKPYVHPVEALHEKVDMAEKFLAAVSDTFMKSCILSEAEKWKVVYPVYDDEVITIGMVGMTCAKEEAYLVDSNFISKRFSKLYPNYRLDYSELLRFGILKQHRRFYKKPLCRLKIDGKVYKNYFCIPMEFVDVDIYNMRWIECSN